MAAPNAPAEAANDQVRGDGDRIDEPADRRVAQALCPETRPDEQCNQDPLDHLQPTAGPSEFGLGAAEIGLSTPDFIDDPST